MVFRSDVHCPKIEPSTGERRPNFAGDDHFFEDELPHV